MLLVGLTGGIGSGKTAVARMLEARGAAVIDADELARVAIALGSVGHARVVERFGRGILSPDGEVDRDRLAGIVFADPGARQDLESIVHPEVARRFLEAVEPFRDTDRVVVYAVPLLVESRLETGFDVVVVVTASEEVRVARLARDRSMDVGAARARIAAQLTDEERERAAGVVIRNDGGLTELREQVDSLWRNLEAQAREGGP